MQNRWNVEVASQMRFWCVPGRFRRESCIHFGYHLAPIFGQKSKKLKKKWIRPSGTVPERPKSAKKRFLRGSENVLFFECFFHWQWLTFGNHFQWKNHPKIHADFELEQVMIFDESMKTSCVPCGYFGLSGLWSYHKKRMVSSKRRFLSFIRTSGPPGLLGTDQSSLWGCPQPSRIAIPIGIAISNPIPNPNPIKNRCVDRLL